MSLLSAFYRRIGVAALLLLATGCSAGQNEGDLSDRVKPADFAILPCAVTGSSVPCAVVMAGGKRILLGAPAGIARGLDEKTLSNLDVVLLFSLRAEHVEGVDEVRNHSWQLGRDAQLKIAGPEGTQDVIAAINRTYELSDAAIFLEQRGAGGFNAPLLVSVATAPATRAEVFNTGDLSVTRVVNTHGQAGYWVDYDGKRVVLEPCGMNQARKFAGEVDASVNCDDENSQKWPLESILFVDRGGGE